MLEEGEEDKEFCLWLFSNHTDLYLDLRREFNKTFKLGVYKEETKLGR